MKLKKLTCPNCDGILDMNIDQNTTSIFCPYCGQKFFLDEEKKEFTINKNINITKTMHKRYTNDADVIRETNKEKENKRSWMALLVVFVILLGIPLAITTKFSIDKKNATSEGKVNAGYYQDLIGEDYKAVEAHFEAAGFKNIKLIDLNDSGIAIWKSGKVSNISIGGDTSFESVDYFDPDTQVVISYH